MPYGSMNASTEKMLGELAVKNGWLYPQIDFDPEPGHTADCRQKDRDHDENNTCDRPWAENVYEISVIFGGALDESFYVGGDYEVNIADALAEDCRTEAAKQDGESWEVLVTEADSDSGVVRYRVSSWDGA